MTTKKPRILLDLDDELLRRIEDFRFSRRIGARAEAIRRLLDEALKKHEKHPPKK
jgi:metal-responsive CopG/Arc/MetJ family transcriptional regulator